MSFPVTVAPPCKFDGKAAKFIDTLKYIPHKTDNVKLKMKMAPQKKKSY